MEVGSSRNFKSDMFTYQFTDDLQSRWWKFCKRQLVCSSNLQWGWNAYQHCYCALKRQLDLDSPPSNSGSLATSNTTWIGRKPELLCATIFQHSLENQWQSYNGQDIEFQLLVLQRWDVSIWDWSWHRKFSRFSGDPPSHNWRLIMKFCFWH